MNESSVARHHHSSILDHNDDDNYSQNSQNSNESPPPPNSPTTNTSNQTKNDPLLTALDDLEGRIIHSLNNFQQHSGVRIAPVNASIHKHLTIHTELQEVLRPVLEIAAHTAPSIARSCTRYRTSIDAALEEVYTRLNSDLILPVLRVSAQSETCAPKRAAALAFFPALWRECKLSGSWLDVYSATGSGGLYGDGSSDSLVGRVGGSRSSTGVGGAAINVELKKARLAFKSIRTAELLRNWIEGATACTVPGSFTGEKAEGSILSRAVISSGAVVRPALKLVAQKIGAADDAGALRLFLPVMRMIGGVLGRLFHDGNGPTGKNSIVTGEDGLKSACIKFLEIVVLCFSTRGQSGDSSKIGNKGARGQTSAITGDEFSLDDLPVGHPHITREVLEEVGDDAFTILRGLISVGGQVRVVKNDIMKGLVYPSGSGSTTPAAQIVAILKPAALSYLDIEKTHSDDSKKSERNESDLVKPLNRTNLEMDFTLSQKSYAVAINAISMLAIQRPIFFQDSAKCLARRAMDLPSIPSGDDGVIPTLLSKSAAISIRSHLKASCLTLLRHTLSLTTNSSINLHFALSSNEMKLQADKALKKAQDDLKVKNSSRAGRKAATYYEWDQSASTTMEDLAKKRKRAGDDALERMRQVKAARGLGNGIQLPTSMTDAVELILINLTNLPPSRSAVASIATTGLASMGDKKAKRQIGNVSEKRRPINLYFVVDAIMTNGASLVSDESRWYMRDGGGAWMMDVATYVSDDDNKEGKEEVETNMDQLASEKTTKRGPSLVTFTIDTKTLDAANASMQGKETDESKIYADQCRIAASDAFYRIVSRANSARESTVADFGNSIASRLAWSLKGVKSSQELGRGAFVDVITTDPLRAFTEEFPLVSSCFAFDMDSNAKASATADMNRNENTGKYFARLPSTLTNRILCEAYLDDIRPMVKGKSSSEWNNQGKTKRYENGLKLYVLSILHACKKADDKPNDTRCKRLATVAANCLTRQLAIAPAVTASVLELTSAICDIDAITKKSSEASRNNSKQTLTASAAMHAAKAAAEKRATGALLVLRDVAFQRSKGTARQIAVNCAVGIAAGRLPASHSIEDKALKLVMNVLFPKSSNLANTVVASATEELEMAAAYAIENYDKIKNANLKPKSSQRVTNQLSFQSREEKVAMDQVRKPVVLFAALCLRRPEIIKTLMSISCRKNAHILAKAVRNNMPKLARAAAKKYGDAKIALQVAELANISNNSETQLLFAFLDNLSPSDGNLPSQALIDACHAIQLKKIGNKSIKDARFIIPVVSGMKRQDLIAKLPEFVAADDIVFKAALHRMSERLGRHALLFRTEASIDTPSLCGMTLCEQIVYLHRLDFAAASLPQKRYLDVIRICLENEEVFTHSVIKEALDHISQRFLAGEKLPLAYMRTIILTCTTYDSLHLWICDILLPRLIKGKVYTDKRQWEGWMRCAKMLENTGDDGVSSLTAIKELPQEQYQMYRARRR